MSSTSTARLSLPLTALLVLAAFAACGDRAPRTALGPDGPGLRAASASLVPEGVEACGETTEVRLMAGQYLEVGAVTIANDEDNLYVTYVTRDGWTLQATHLEVVSSLGDVPTSGPGNPQVGHFGWPETHSGGTTRYTHTIPLSELGVEAGDDVVVAAHAEAHNSSLDRTETAWGEGTRFVESGGNWATYLDFTVQECAQFCSALDPVAIAPFEDPNLQEAVRSSLLLPAGTEPTCGQVATLTFLRAQNAGIIDLTGIESLIHLERAVLSTNPFLPGEPNEISDLSPLSDLAHLEYLAVSHNAVSEVGPLSDLTNLEQLVLNGNSIGDIAALGELTNLRSMWVSDNEISSLAPMDQLTQLLSLRADNNAISDLTPLEGLVDLRTLSLSQNEIADVGPLEELTALETLALRGNDISDLGPLAGLTALEVLALDDNTVSDLAPLSELTSVYNLFLSQNDLTDLDGLEGLSELALVQVSYNPDLADIQGLLDNPGFGGGDRARLYSTSVSCADIAALRDNGVDVGVEPSKC